MNTGHLSWAIKSLPRSPRAALACLTRGISLWMPTQWGGLKSRASASCHQAHRSLQTSRLRSWLHIRISWEILGKYIYAHPTLDKLISYTLEWVFPRVPAACDLHWRMRPTAKWGLSDLKDLQTSFSYHMQWCAAELCVWGKSRGHQDNLLLLHDFATALTGHANIDLCGLACKLKKKKILSCFQITVFIVFSNNFIKI